MYNKANIIDRFRLDGKVALVTGGSGYYGKQMVIALADAGAVVCCVCCKGNTSKKEWGGEGVI